MMASLEFSTMVAIRARSLSTSALRCWATLIMPARTEARPIATDSAIVERRLHAIRCAAITGTTINAAISRIPTMRIEIPIVSAASRETAPFRTGTGRPLTRAPSSSIATASSERSSTATRISEPRPSSAIRVRSVRVTVRIDPNRYENRFAFSAPADEISTTPPAMPV